MDILTALAFILCAGKASGTMAVAWVWVLLPLYLRCCFAAASWFGYLFRDLEKKE